MTDAVEIVNQGPSYSDAGWRLIESAPKDGTEILAYGPWAGEINGIGSPRLAVVSWQYGGASDYVGFHWTVSGTDGYAAWLCAAFWMPLPEAPK